MTGCAGLSVKDDSIWTQHGVASWYGRDFHGKPTASGERYNMYKVSAAHKTLPLGTKARVTNLDNGRSVVVIINDRGPFVGTRIIDMSYGAAKKLAMVDEGLANVRIDVISMPGDYTQGYFTLQFGSFGDKANATAVQHKLKSMGYNPTIEEGTANGRTVYRVRLGKFITLSRAQKAQEPFDAAGIESIVVGL